MSLPIQIPIFFVQFEFWVDIDSDCYIFFLHFTSSASFILFLLGCTDYYHNLNKMWNLCASKHIHGFTTLFQTSNCNYEVSHLFFWHPEHTKKVIEWQDVEMHILCVQQLSWNFISILWFYSAPSIEFWDFTFVYEMHFMHIFNLTLVDGAPLLCLTNLLNWP